MWDRDLSHEVHFSFEREVAIAAEKHGVHEMVIAFLFSRRKVRRVFQFSKSTISVSLDNSFLFLHVLLHTYVSPGLETAK